MDHEISYQSLLIVMVLASLMPLILTRFRKINIPIVVGEIIAGVIIGKSGFQWVSNSDLLISFLSEFGLVFLMFLAGMEIDMSFLRTQTPINEKPKVIENPIFLAGMHFFLTLSLSILVSFILYQMGFIRNAWMMALILSTTSLGVVVPVLKEKNIIRSKYGQTILISALFADFATMLLITVLVGVLSKGLSFEILLIGLLFIGFFVVYRFTNLFFNRFASVRKVIDELSFATTQIKVRMAIAIMLVLVALSEVIGSEIILGAFMAGMVIRLIATPADAHVEEQLETIGYGFFIPIFFIHVGTGIDIPAMLSSTNVGILVPILVVSAIIVKLLPAMVFKNVFSWKESIAAGFLLASRLSLIIAAVAIGVKLEVISTEVQSVIILIAVFTVTLFPPLFSFLIPSVSALIQRKYVIVGASKFGQEIAEQLYSHGEQVTLALLPDENNKIINAEKINKVYFSVNDDLSHDFKSILGNGTQIICATGNADKSLEICKSLKSFDGNANVLALLENPNVVTKFKEINIDTFSWLFDVPAMIAAMVRNPIAYQMLADTNSDKEIFEVIIQNRFIFRKRIRDIRLPGDVLIISVRRNGEIILPHGGTEIQRGDSVTIAGSKDCLCEARELLS
jgi:Kef-type K+ transport system membrane component KefB/Trk K+ transport system NAD-binding subunit